MRQILSFKKIRVKNIIENKKLVTNAVLIFFYLLVLLFLPFFLQYLHLGTLKGTYNWFSSSLHGEKMTYFKNFIPLLMIFLFLYPLINSGIISFFLVLTTALILGVANMQKMRILHQPLFPTDIIFLKQALTVVEMYKLQVMLWLLLIFVLLITAFFLKKKINEYKLPLPLRIVFFVIVILCIAILDFENEKYIKRKPLSRNIKWDPIENFNRNGFLYSFVANTKTLPFARPPAYNKKIIDSLFSKFIIDTIQDSFAFSPSKRYPDVVVYVNESFWDITEIKAVKPPKDPIPLFRELTKRYPSFKIVSPVFGGNTCIAEFELLTGLPHTYFPAGAIAYNQFINKPIPSLVRIFKENGYECIAIHTYKKWFWNRFNVYRHVGFDEFISVERMENPEKKGFYVSDKELSKQIIEYLKKVKDKPLFIFALSMQNHGPHNCKRYDTLDYYVNTGLSRDADLEYNTYFQGVKDADASLKMLKQYIDKRKRPTLLFFFGDHLPALNEVYKETKYKNIIEENWLWSHTVPALVYANFKIPPARDSIVSMVYMPVIISEYAGIKIPLYYFLLKDIKNKDPICGIGKTRTEFLEKDTILKRISLERESIFKYVIYDALFGKELGKKYYYCTTLYDDTSFYKRGIDEISLSSK